MEQMNDINQNNIINSSLLRRTHNEVSINSPQRKILDSIIGFYYKNGNSDFDEKIQIINLINLLTPNYSMIKIDNETKDPLYYIEGEEKIIKLVTYDFKLINVRIPCSISKRDLYSIAWPYKTLFSSEIMLVHNNNILKEDESSIDNIQNEDIITIIESIVFPDDSYYNNLIQNNRNEEMINVCFKDNNNSDFILYLEFPKNVTINELQKAFYLKFGYNKANMNLYNYSYNSLNDYNDKKVYELFIFTIYFRIAGEGLLGTYIQTFGKVINVEIEYALNHEIMHQTTQIGLLNTCKDLINYIEASLSDSSLKIKRMYLNKKEVNINEIKSLASLGINNDCVCFVEF